VRLRAGGIPRLAGGMFRPRVVFVVVAFGGSCQRRGRVDHRAASKREQLSGPSTICGAAKPAICRRPMMMEKSDKREFWGGCQMVAGKFIRRLPILCVLVASTACADLPVVPTHEISLPPSEGAKIVGKPIPSADVHIDDEIPLPLFEAKKIVGQPISRPDPHINTSSTSFTWGVIVFCLFGRSWRRSVESV
jgi:hypothetical protein